MPFLLTAGALLDVGRSLREAFFMFWETLWPIALGFGLSGAIQAFVGRKETAIDRLGGVAEKLAVLNELSKQKEPNQKPSLKYNSLGA